MKELVFFSGWALDERLWQHLLPWPDRPWRWVDLHDSKALATRPTTPVILIAHSLGCLWALCHYARDGDVLLSINGMTCFSHRQNFPSGIDIATVAALRKAIAASHRRAALQNFFRWCLPHDTHRMSALIAAAEALPTAQLEEGLRWLAELDGRDGAAIVDIRALAARDDRVVPRALSAACFTSAQLTWCDSASHLLPLTHPELCREWVRQALG